MHSLIPPSLQELRELVIQAAREELIPRFADVIRHVKHDGSVVTEADVAMQQRLKSDLARQWPQYEFLGEEMPKHEHVQLTTQADKGIWCVDPLDGTSNFATGIPYFAVSLALVINGRQEIGLVYDPVRDECFMARRDSGARLNDMTLGVHEPPLPARLERCVAAVDFKRLDSALGAQLGAHPPYGSQRNFGASSLEWCWLADGRFHLYLHGGQKLWDFAGGSLILSEAGGVASTLAGDRVFQYGLESRSVVASATPALFKVWKSWIDENWKPA